MWSESCELKVLYWAIVLLCVVVLVWKSVSELKPAENYMGKGFATPGFEAFSGPSARGATLRRLGPEDSQPIRGSHDTLYINEYKEHVPTESEASKKEGYKAPELSKAEALTNGRGEPDFWEVGNVLAAYRREQSPFQQVDSKVEHLAEGSPAAQAEEEILKTYLYN